MARKIPTVKEEQVKKMFEEQTGIPATEITEILDAFPASYGITIHTNSRTFHGWLTYEARLKKNSLTEEK